MAAPVEVKLRNAESSILFMQQEHAKTLQALHQELHKLQKKCAELTFELAMKSDDVEEEQYKSEIQELNEKLDSKDKECSRLMKERDLFHVKYSDLVHHMKLREKIFQDDIVQKGQKIVVLTTELEQRSGMIAHLTTQLHQLKLKQVTPRIEHGTRIEPERVSSPSPPKDPAPPGVRRYNLRTGNGPIRGVRGSGHTRSDAVPEPSQAQSHVFTKVRGVGPRLPANHEFRPTRGENVHVAFIAQVDPLVKEVEVKPAPSVLPPITPQESARIERSLSAEIETLAIEKPYGGDNTLRSPNHSPVHTNLK